MEYDEGQGIGKSFVGASGTSFVIQTICTHLCRLTAGRFVT